MRSQTVRLEAIEDPETREIGLILQESKYSLLATNDPIVGDGALIAHDLLEHINGISNIGGISEELEALGAVIHVRGHNGPLREGNYHHSYEEGLASDLSNMFFKWLDKGFERRIPVTIASCGIEEELAEIIELAKHEIISESEYNDASLTSMPEYLSGCKHFMRTGYRKAVKKYKKLDGWELYSLFMDIAKAVDSVSIDYQGQEFELVYGSNGVFIDEHYDYEGEE